MDEIERFEAEVAANIAGLREDRDVQALSRMWIRAIARHRYAYNFKWMGRPLIQFPQDMVAVQELVWDVRPDLIIETGIAHGGSLIMNASLLAMLDYCDAVESGGVLDPRESRRRVLGIDIDIRAHNRRAIEGHPMASRIELLQGSSIDPDIVAKARAVAGQHSRVMVLLDSNHTHDHVLEELRAFAPLVSAGSYCVVFDTLIEDMPADLVVDRPWGIGNNPKTAVRAYLGETSDFEVDETIESKLSITVAPGGYLRRRA